MEQSESQKAFGKYHDLVLLFLGFFLTTIVGGYLSYSWQIRSAEIQSKADQKRFEILTAKKIFEEISRLMDKRLYHMRRINMGLSNNTGSKGMDERWATYRKILFEWNENLNKNLALTQIYFGQKARDILQYIIQTKFIKLGKSLESARHNRMDKSTYEERRTLADDINNNIYNLDLMMIKQIQNGNVGTSMSNNY